MSGVSFLPFSDASYRQMPYQDIDEGQYQAALEKMPKNVDWSKLGEYETTDQTVSAQTLACSGPEGCDI